MSCASVAGSTDREMDAVEAFLATITPHRRRSKLYDHIEEILYLYKQGCSRPQICAFLQVTYDIKITQQALNDFVVRMAMIGTTQAKAYGAGGDLDCDVDTFLIALERIHKLQLIECGRVPPSVVKLRPAAQPPKAVPDFLAATRQSLGGASAPTPAEPEMSPEARLDAAGRDARAMFRQERDQIGTPERAAIPSLRPAQKQTIKSFVPVTTKPNESIC